MRCLLVSPALPPTYWGFQLALNLAGRRAALPPLGLISLAALLPADWTLRLVDLDTGPLTDADLAWADVVVVGGMRIQAPSMHQVLARARAAGRRTVVGGPAPTTAPEEFLDADVVFRGEAEGRVDELVAAIAAVAPGRGPRVLAAAGERPEMSGVPVPRFDLLDFRRYASMSVQYSRGCPFRCEFCDIVEIFGRKPRVKATAQVLAELDALAARGYRGTLFFVDDNFIGNRPAVRRLLPELAEWQRRRGYPFELYTEASLDLAADDELIDDMVEAGFTAVFLGIETPSAAALAGAGKTQNLRLDPVRAVHKLATAGLESMGGFIVGFDQDEPSIFGEQQRLIRDAPVPLAMVGMLTALPGTALWRRLEREGRLREASAGDQFARPNFRPVMEERTLLTGYAELLRALYAPAAYFRRCEDFVRLARRTPGRGRPRPEHLLTLLRTAFDAGVKSPWRRHFWRLLGSASRRPHTLRWAVSHAVMGQHLIRYTRDEVLPRIERALAEAPGGVPA
ncbi:MAG TPA: B12-binding domain-containing radical SAM protein [Thermoanaerobaculia bacterium]